ncbi:MAG: serine O-acetyltransferase EpsC [Eubacterium sp.]|nr:serine O-acetyltransferase EpsC [Eubacterium sp.]
MDCKHKKPENKVDCIVCEILADYDNNREIDRMEFFGQPDQDVVIDILKKLMMIVYPGYYRDEVYRTHTAKNRVAVLIEDVMYNLRKQLEIVLVNDKRFKGLDKQERKECAQELCLDFLSKIPKIREYLNTDIDAAFDGDPAATDRIEIVIAYPGLHAITAHRIAHELFLMNIPYIPRIMSEYAHSETGVDIHPGATIGKYFFIDHATGIVIGETAIIGDNVKIYQGVTIGALSTKDGQLLHGVKRHPTIEDNVTLYAGATVLGGKTVIGKGSVIGGNAFVTHSIEPNTSVIVKTESTVISNV